MTAKVSPINPKLANAFGRLSALAAPTPVKSVEAPSTTAQPVVTEEPVITSKPAKKTAVRSPKPTVDIKLETLARSTPKPATVMVEKPVSNPPGRPTQKTGDLKRDYVKISPAIPRALKDRLDDAFPSLKRDPANGVVTMEDVVTQALNAYLSARGR